MLWDGCVTCLLYNQLDNVAIEFSEKAFSALEGPARHLFGSLFALWMVWQIGIKALVTADFDLKSFVRQFFVMIVIAAVLESLDLYWDWVFQTARGATTGLAQVLIKPVAEHLGELSIEGLLTTLENEMKLIADNSISMMRDSGWSVLQPLAAIFLLVPFFFVWGIFLAYVLEGFFKLMAVTTLAPVFIAISAFSTLRGFSIGAIRVAIGGMLTVVFASVAMGFTLMTIRFYTSHLPMTAGGRLGKGAAAEFLFSGEYFALVIVGFISILFHLKAATLASNISGALDGPGAAAAVSGAMMGAGLALGRYALRTAQRVPKGIEQFKQARERAWQRARGS